MDMRGPREAVVIVLTRDYGGWLRKESWELETSEHVQYINRISRLNVVDREVLRITAVFILSKSEDGGRKHRRRTGFGREMMSLILTTVNVRSL